MSPEAASATGRIAGFLDSLDVEIRLPGEGAWAIALEAAGLPLEIGLRLRGPLLSIRAAVLPGGLIDPHQLLYWNGQAPFVAFAESAAGEVLLCAELPLAGLDEETLDRCLGLLVAAATRARDVAIGRPG